MSENAMRITLEAEPSITTADLRIHRCWTVRLSMRETGTHGVLAYGDEKIKTIDRAIERAETMLTRLRMLRAANLTTNRP